MKRKLLFLLISLSYVQSNAVLRHDRHYNDWHQNPYGFIDITSHRPTNNGHIPQCVFDNCPGDQIEHVQSRVAVENSTKTQPGGVDERTMNRGKSGKAEKFKSKTDKWV
ncbi:hypothetical protein ACHAWX_000040, partial [Stephanocyclus meneghinianus]